MLICSSMECFISIKAVPPMSLDITNLWMQFNKQKMQVIFPTLREDLRTH